METKFQTSFIPKKPVASVGAIGGVTPTPPKRKSNSILMTIALFLFLLSLGAAGGVYFWKGLLLSSQESYKTQLAQREKQFNTRLIEELKRQDIKITTIDQLLSNHLSISDVFDILGSFTIQNVRFSSLDLTAPANSSEEIKVSMKGVAANFSAVAFQSQVFNTLDQYGLRGIVKNPILSDPVLDSAGTVSFNFTASIDPSALSYRNALGASALNN